MTALLKATASLYDSSTRRLRRSGLIALGVALLLLFLPLLLFPLGPDTGLFFVSGQKIIHQGAVHYRDIVDVKPPAIYYLNALAIGLFGDRTISIRILDIILQLATCAMMFRLLRRATDDDRAGIVALILYPLFYLGFNYANTSQVESFVGLLMVPAIGLMMYRRTTSGFLLAGVLCGLTILLKFTFGVTLIALLLGDFWIYRDAWKARVVRWSTVLLGFGAVVALFLLYLVAFDAWDGFWEMQTFLTGYTGMQLTTAGGFLGAMAEGMLIMLGNYYSPLMLLGTAIAIAVAVRGRPLPARDETDADRSDATPPHPHDRTIALLRFAAILFLMLLLSIAVEGKWVHYHLLRLGGAGVILTSVGLIQLVRIVARRPRTRIRTVAIVALIPVLLILGPLTRYVYHVRPTLLLLTDGPEAFDSFYAHTRGADDWRMGEIDSIGRYLRQSRRAGEKIYVSSGVAGMIYLRADYLPDLPIYHSGFLIAPFAPDRWRDTTAAWLLAERPRFVVLQKSDRMYLITGTFETSVELFRRMPEVWEMLETDYRIAKETPAFILFERSAPSA